jgi:putative ABC transport system ATP-binding protein
MDVLQTINNQGITLLIVTHEEDIANMCKRIVHLRDGIIVSDKKVTQVKASQYVE